MTNRDVFGHLPDFPIISGRKLTGVPWGMAERVRFYMLIHHGGTIEQVAARGGLTAAHFLAALYDWPPGDPKLENRDCENSLEYQSDEYRRKPKWD